MEHVALAVTVAVAVAIGYSVLRWYLVDRTSFNPFRSNR